MNDADRLRAAADKLDGTVSAPSDLYWDASADQMAALLRAVADATDSNLRNFGIPALDDDRPLRAALAVADAVLEPDPYPS